MNQPEPSVSDRHLSRRTMLKAASAAGIVWASPLVHSVPAHAASVCTDIQFGPASGGGSPGIEAPTPASTDDFFGPSCTNKMPACTPQGGTGSLCTCGAFGSHASRTTGDVGTWLGSDALGWTYQAPGDCTVISAEARVRSPNDSGCNKIYRCVTGTIDPNTAKFVSFAGLSSLSPTPAAGAVYWKFRMVLCCTNP